MARLVTLSNSRGFTLVEVMISLIIILVALLGLVQASLLSMESGLRNQFRDEAVRIGAQRLNGVLTDTSGTSHNGLRTLPFDDAGLTAGGPNCFDIRRDFRNIVKDYRVCTTIRDLTSDVKNLQITVGWDHRKEAPFVPKPTTGKEFEHSITSILGRPS
ncbi:MAG: type II secretion system GspH family protein [Nitrospirae bacterium]|nr:type II secretion system GspH family protein [Nitrospirota bacterium]